MNKPRERRSLYEMIFGGGKNPAPSASQLRMLNGYVPVFTQFGHDAYASDDVRAAADAFARNAAKLAPKHIRKDNAGNTNLVDDTMQYVLSVAPNPFMDAYTFYYKVATQYLVQNNAFVYVRWDSAGNLLLLWPLNGATTEWLEFNGEVFARFQFMGGQQVTVPYTDLIHLRRFFYNSDLFGETNMQALSPTLQLIQAVNDGIVNAIKSSAFVRGILKFTQMLKREDKNKRRDDFIADNFNMTNNSGVGVVDGACDYQELKGQPQTANAAQMQIIRDKINRYFGVSDAIIKNDYTSAQWNAFYSSMLEPFAVQMSLQFTAKLFTGRERGFGNEIIFEANRLQYASNQEKVNVVTLLSNIGAITLDQALEIFNLPTIGGEEGGRRVQTLNMVKAGKGADKYQGINNDDGTGENEDGT